MKQYVIIGGGTASIGCIEGIRSVDKIGKIVLVCGEEQAPYCRPLISYLLEGKTDLEKMKFRADDYYEKNGCEVIFAQATEINADAQTVGLSEGRSISYDSLCVATGSVPFVPPLEGLDTVERRFTFMTEADALALEKAITDKSKVLIIGAGLIGLKCAEGLSRRVKEITVCDLAPNILSSVLDAESSLIMQKKLEEHGIKFMLSDSAERFEGNTAYMKSGERADFDVLVLAVGVRANISLIKDKGGRCEHGIITDTKMRTSLNNIYAAGDCAQGYDLSAEENRIIAILPNAYMQGKCAGINMAGGTSVFENGIPMNAVGFFGLHALTAGSCKGKICEEASTDGAVKKLYINNGVLNGFILIGDVKGAGIYTSMIRNKTPISSADIESLIKNPSLASFSEEYRKKTLERVV